MVGHNALTAAVSIINDSIEFPYFLHAYANIFPLDTTVLNLVDMGQGNAQLNSHSGRLGKPGNIAV